MESMSPPPDLAKQNAIYPRRKEKTTQQEDTKRMPVVVGEAGH